MKRRDFFGIIGAALAAFAVPRAVQAAIKEKDDDARLRREIEALFDYVHPELGTYAYFEDEDGQNNYITYALACHEDTPENRRWLRMSMFATFTALRSHCAPIKQQGAWVMYDSPAKTQWTTGWRKRLYWRIPPSVERNEWEDEYGIMQSNITVWCRAVVK